MNAHLLYAHPEPTSFAAALKNAAINELMKLGWTVHVSDLYADQFNPVAGRHDFSLPADPIRFHYQTEQKAAHDAGTFSAELVREQERFQGCDLFVPIFPLWWGAPPAIMKGWFDRVLAYGFAYVDGRRFDTGFFKGTKAIACVVTGGTRERFSSDGVYGEIERVLWPLQHCTLRYMGFNVEEPFVAYAAPRVTLDERQSYLAQWRRTLSQISATAKINASSAADLQS